MKTKKSITCMFVCVFLSLMVSTSHAQIEEKEFETVKHRIRTGNMHQQLQELQRIESSRLPLETLQDLLSPALESNDLRVKLRAVTVLYKEGDRESAELLFEVLDGNRSPNEKVRVAQTIIRFKDYALVDRLRNYLKTSEDYYFVLTIAEALLYDVNNQTISRSILGQLQTALVEGDVSIKTRAISILCGLGDEGVRSIGVALGDPDASVRQEAFRQLTEMGGKAAIEAIRPYAQHEDIEVMYQAAYALGVLGEPSYFRFIKRDLNDEDTAVQRRALSFLKAIIGDASNDTFVETIKRLAEYADNEDVKQDAEEYLELYSIIKVQNQSSE